PSAQRTTPDRRSGVESWFGGRGAPTGAPDQGTTRWTGLPLMFTPHVVVSLAEFIWYSIFHQPGSVSPGGVRPVEPYVAGRGIVTVTIRLLNWAAPPTEVWIWVTFVPDRPSSEVQLKVV